MGLTSQAGTQCSSVLVAMPGLGEVRAVQADLKLLNVAELLHFEAGQDFPPSLSSWRKPKTSDSNS